MSQIYHAHLYGTRNHKYDWLQDYDVQSTDWEKLQPQSPFYLLIPQNIDVMSEYNQGWKIGDVMPVNSTGVKTHRDHFCISLDSQALLERIRNFRNTEISDNQISDDYKIKDTRDWNLHEKRAILSHQKQWESFLTKICYSPFDWRSYYHHADRCC